MDPFTGPLAIWLLLFCILAIVEVLAILIGYRKGDRKIALLASCAWVLQLGVIHYQYWILSGV